MIIKDSGKRRTFSTGSVRDVRDGKGRFDLIPPEFLRAMAKHYELGAAKYGDKNWERGQPLSCYLDSAFRHSTAVLAGDQDEPHAEAAAWNWAAFITTRERILAGILPADLAEMGVVKLPKRSKSLARKR